MAINAVVISHSDPGAVPGASTKFEVLGFRDEVLGKVQSALPYHL